MVEVQGLDEVKKLGAAVRGKIVFYNRPMTYGGKGTYGSYGRTVDQRYRGAAVAARQGAVAVLVRSMTALPDDDNPHTGMLKYEEGVAMIPAAALSTHSANELSALLKSDPKLDRESEAQRRPTSRRLLVQCHRRADRPRPSARICGGRRPPRLVGSGDRRARRRHGRRAIDRSRAGSESARLAPRRTVRVVLFMAEEFGGMGAKEYASSSQSERRKALCRDRIG